MSTNSEHRDSCKPECAREREAHRTRLLRAARFYRKRGMVITPNKASTTKAAYLPGWGHRELTLSQLAAELDRPGKGIGVVLGEVSGALVDIDLDHAAAVYAADVLLPPTRLVSGRTDRPRTHRFYRSPGSATAAFKARSTGMLVELRAAGCQTVLPPSSHPAGRYHWDSLGEPTVVDATLLRRLTGQVAVAAYRISEGMPVEHAIAFARHPDSHRLAEWRRDHENAPPLRAWLSPRLRPAACSSRGVRGSSAQAASPFTSAVLDRVGEVVGAARLLGLELREGHQRCPWHRGRGQRSLQVTGPLWRCHAGCGSGNAIHLAAKILGVSYRRARSALAELLGVPRRGDPERPGGPRGGGVKQSKHPSPLAVVRALDEAGEARRAKRASDV